MYVFCIVSMIISFILVSRNLFASLKGLNKSWKRWEIYGFSSVVVMLFSQFLVINRWIENLDFDRAIIICEKELIWLMVISLTIIIMSAKSLQIFIKNDYQKQEEENETTEDL